MFGTLQFQHVSEVSNGALKRRIFIVEGDGGSRLSAE